MEEAGLAKVQVLGVSVSVPGGKRSQVTSQELLGPDLWLGDSVSPILGRWWKPTP